MPRGTGLEISNSRRIAAIERVSGIGRQEDPPEKTRPPEGWPFDKLPSPRHSGHSGQAGQASAKDKNLARLKARRPLPLPRRTTNKSKGFALENRGWDGKSNSKTNGTGVEPGDLARFFVGWKPVCRQAGLALPPGLCRQRQIKPGCRARRTPSSVRASRRYV